MILFDALVHSHFGNAFPERNGFSRLQGKQKSPLSVCASSRSRITSGVLLTASVTHPHRRAMRVVMMVKMAVAQHDDEEMRLWQLLEFCQSTLHLRHAARANPFDAPAAALIKFIRYTGWVCRY